MFAFQRSKLRFSLSAELKSMYRFSLQHNQQIYLLFVDYAKGTYDTIRLDTLWKVLEVQGVPLPFLISCVTGLPSVPHKYVSAESSQNMLPKDFLWPLNAYATNSFHVRPAYSAARSHSCDGQSRVPGLPKCDASMVRVPKCDASVSWLFRGNLDLAAPTLH